MLRALFFVSAFTPAAAAQPVMAFRPAQQPSERQARRLDWGFAKDHDVADFAWRAVERQEDVAVLRSTAGTGTYFKGER